MYSDIRPYLCGFGKLNSFIISVFGQLVTDIFVNLFDEFVDLPEQLLLARLVYLRHFHYRSSQPVWRRVIFFLGDTLTAFGQGGKI